LACLDGLREDVGGHDFGALQLNAALQDQGQGQNGTQNQGPNGPTCGLYDGQQKNTFPFLGLERG
jgi:hypothetical protein